MLEFQFLPGVEAVCHPCDKRVKDKELNGFLLARHLYNCGRCQGGGAVGQPPVPAVGAWGGAGSASWPDPRAAWTEGHSQVAADGEWLVPPPVRRACGQPTGTIMIPRSSCPQFSEKVVTQACIQNIVGL